MHGSIQLLGHLTGPPSPETADVCVTDGAAPPAPSPLMLGWIVLRGGVTAGVLVLPQNLCYEGTYLSVNCCQSVKACQMRVAWDSWPPRCKRGHYLRFGKLCWSSHCQAENVWGLWSFADANLLSRFSLDSSSAEEEVHFGADEKSEEVLNMDGASLLDLHRFTLALEQILTECQCFEPLPSNVF